MKLGWQRTERLYRLPADGGSQRMAQLGEDSTEQVLAKGLGAGVLLEEPASLAITAHVPFVRQRPGLVLTNMVHATLRRSEEQLLVDDLEFHDQLHGLHPACLPR